MLNPIALRKTKIVYNFGLFECKRVSGKSLFLSSLLIPQFIRTSSVRVANNESHKLFPFIN